MPRHFKALSSALAFALAVPPVITVTTAATVSLATLATLATMTPTTAHAGAFYLPERGGRALSLGGAFIAGVDDLNAQWLNPAGLTRLDKSLSLYLDFGLIFSDQRFLRQDSEEARRKDPTLAEGYPEVTDEGGPFPDPSLGIATNFGLKDWVFALGVYGPYAGTNKWPEDGPQRYSIINLQALELFVQLSAAWRPNDHFAVGVGLQSVTTGIKQRLKISAYPGVFGWNEQRDLDVLAEVDVTDPFSLSGNLGVLITPTSKDAAIGLDIGLSVQLPVAADASGKLSLQKPGHYYFSTTEIEGDKIEVSLDFPWIVRAGVRLYDEDLWSVELAAVFEAWSALDQIAVAPGEGGIAFVGVPGIGRYEVEPFALDASYEDVFSARVGASFAPGRGPLTLRMGTFFETGAPPSKTLTVLDIDGNKLGVTLGGTFEFGAFQIDLAAAWIETFEQTVTDSSKAQVNPIYLADPQPYDETGPSTIGNGTYSARNFILATSISAGF